MPDQLWTWLVMTFASGLHVIAEVLVTGVETCRPVLDDRYFFRARKLMVLRMVQAGPEDPQQLDRLEFDPFVEMQFKLTEEIAYRKDILVSYAKASNRAAEEADRIISGRPKLLAVSGNGRAQKILDDLRGGGG